MSNDNFLRVLFNAGEQALAADFNDAQRMLLNHLMSMMTLPNVTNPGNTAAATTKYEIEQAEFSIGGSQGPLDVAFCPYPAAGYVVPGGGARQLVVGTPGPVCQLLSAGAFDPASGDPPLISYWMDANEFTLTTAIGDVTNPRVDLVEMQLQQVDDGSVSRVFAIQSVKASKDLNPLTTNCETVIRARNGGIGGNNLTIAFLNDGAGAGSITHNGNAITFHYQSGVTTVANFETAVGTDNLIEVQTVDGVGTLAHPGDTFTASALAGGVDQKLVSQTVNKKRRTQATFQIKQGTPAATPAFPAPSAGFVPICAVFVPANQNAVHTITNLSDMRWPLGGLRAYDVGIQGMNPQASAGTAWTQNLTNWTYTSPVPSASLAAPCPVGGNVGRLVGIGIEAFFPGTGSCTLSKKVGAGPPTLTNLFNLSTPIVGEQSADLRFVWANAIQLMDNLVTPATRGTRAASTRVGAPMWTNGEFCGPAFKHNITSVPGGPAGYTNMQKLCLLISGTTGSNVISTVRFYVAHGMG